MFFLFPSRYLYGMFRKDNAAVIQVSYFQIQWGSEYLTVVYFDQRMGAPHAVRWSK